MSIFDMDAQYNRDRIVRDQDNAVNQAVSEWKEKYAALATAARKYMNAVNSPANMSIGGDWKRQQNITEKFDALAALLAETRAE